MTQVIKLPEEQVKQLNSIRDKYYQVMTKLGDADIQIYNLNKIKDELLKEYNTIQEEEKGVIDGIGKKYGFGKINLKTGELIIENNSPVPQKP